MSGSHDCKQCDELQKEIAELKKRLSYYENPNSPPSSDSLHWKRQKKQRRSEHHYKPGQKLGHKGTTHSFKPTQTIHHKSEQCSRCGSKKIIQTTQKTRIIAEIPKPQPVTITKHIIPSYVCNNCGNVQTTHCNLPKKGCLGFYLVGIITSLWSARIPVRNISKMIQIFHSLKLSASTINNSLCNTSDSLEPLVNQIKDDICASKTAHFDETKYSIHGKTGWVWTGVNQNSCLITVEKSRGQGVLQKHFDSFAGVAVCDGWVPYHIFNTRQRCWAHILREAKYVAEKLSTENSQSLYLSLQKLFHSIKDVQSSRTVHDSALNLFERIISEHCNEKQLEKFINKLDNAKDDLFTFLLYDGVEPTNNTAERALREPVINRKIRGCVRNQKGMRMFGNLMSCIMTWNMRGCNLLDEIVKYV